MGSGGLAAGRVAAALGFRVAMVERDRAGGTAAWTGDVPSKALAAAAAAAHTMRTADRFGLPPASPVIDLPAVWQRIKVLQASIAVDEARRGLTGVEIVTGTGVVTGPQQVTVDGRHTLEAAAILLATGSRPLVPAIEGLATAGFLTTDDLFAVDAPPSSLLVIGGGPTGVELAQALNRLGVTVTLFEQRARLLADEEPGLSDELTAMLASEGVDVHLRAEVVEVTTDGSRRVVHARASNQRVSVAADAILLAAGRLPNVEDLGLEACGVAVGPDGVTTDRRGRTTVGSIYVAGDLHGRFRYANVARYEGVSSVRDAFFPLWTNRADLFPWCTFTDPELAHVGLTVAEAEARHGDGVDVWRGDVGRTERARIEGTSGTVVVVTAKGRVVGAHLLAPRAGEMIHELALAIRQGARLNDLATLAHVQPTYASAIGGLAADVALERAHRLRWLARRAR